MTGVSSVLLCVSVHQGADKVRVNSRPGKLISLIALTLDCEVAGDTEGAGSSCRERSVSQVGCQIGQQVLFEAGNFLK